MNPKKQKETSKKTPLKIGGFGASVAGLAKDTKLVVSGKGIGVVNTKKEKPKSGGSTSSSSMSGESTSSKKSKGSGSTGRGGGNTNNGSGGRSSGVSAKPVAKPVAAAKPTAAKPVATKTKVVKPTATVAKTNSSKSTGAIVGGYKPKFGIAPKASTASAVSTPSKPKAKSAKNIRQEGRQERRASRQENRNEIKSMRQEARLERKATRQAGRAQRAEMSSVKKSMNQQASQAKRSKKIQEKIAGKNERVATNQAYKSNNKMNKPISLETKSVKVVKDSYGNKPMIKEQNNTIANIEKGIKAGKIISSALSMKSPVKMGQTMQGIAPVQDNPYQDVNQMNYNFDPLSQQRAKQMQMPPQQSPMFKKDFPDLNKDGKITKADILIGRGVKK